MRNTTRGFNIKQNSKGEIPTKCETCTAHEENLKGNNIIDLCSLPYLEDRFLHKANKECSLKTLNDLMINAGITDPQIKSDLILKDITNLQRSGLNPDILMTKINYEIKLQTGYDIVDIRNIDIFAKIIEYIRDAINHGMSRKEIMDKLPYLVTTKCNY